MAIVAVQFIFSRNNSWFDRWEYMRSDCASWNFRKIWHRMIWISVDFYCDIWHWFVIVVIDHFNAFLFDLIWAMKIVCRFRWYWFDFGWFRFHSRTKNEENWKCFWIEKESKCWEHLPLRRIVLVRLIGNKILSTFAQYWRRRWHGMVRMHYFYVTQLKWNVLINTFTVKKEKRFQHTTFALIVDE